MLYSLNIVSTFVSVTGAEYEAMIERLCEMGFVRDQVGYKTTRSTFACYYLFLNILLN